MHTFRVRTIREVTVDGSAAEERFSELREPRDLALPVPRVSSRTTHAGVITICTVPEMLPETWTRGNETHHTDDWATHAGIVTICTVPEMDTGCLGHTHYTLSRTLSGDETTPASPSAALTTGVWW